jgi:hypothetical protein
VPDHIAQMVFDHLGEGSDCFKIAPVSGGQHRLIVNVENPALHRQPLHFGSCGGDKLAPAGTGGVDLVRSELQLSSQ